MSRCVRHTQATPVAGRQGQALPVPAARCSARLAWRLGHGDAKVEANAGVGSSTQPPDKAVKSHRCHANGQCQSCWHWRRFRRYWPERCEADTEGYSERTLPTEHLRRLLKVTRTLAQKQLPVAPRSRAALSR